MRDDVARDLNRSAKAFRDVVWPAIGAQLGGGEVIPVESVTTSGFAKDLDVKAGIDAWVTYGSTHIRGIASRCQWIEGRPFTTFTVRMARLSGAKTEYEKQRLRIATPGAIYPHFTIQAYLRKGFEDQLIIAVAAKTSDVIGAVQLGIGFERTNRSDGTKFWCVPWRELYDSGAEMWWYPPKVKKDAA